MIEPKRKNPGDPIELGDILGHPQEPDERYARVMAIRKDIRNARGVTFRRYEPGDGWFPTGTYGTSAFVCAWEPPYVVPG